MTTVPLTNWAGNVRFRAEQWHRPASIAELQRLVRSARVRASARGIRSTRSPTRPATWSRSPDCPRGWTSTPKRGR